MWNLKKKFKPSGFSPQSSNPIKSKRTIIIEHVIIWTVRNTSVTQSLIQNEEKNNGWIWNQMDDFLWKAYSNLTIVIWSWMSVIIFIMIMIMIVIALHDSHRDNYNHEW